MGTLGYSGNHAYEKWDNFKRTLDESTIDEALRLLRPGAEYHCGDCITLFQRYESTTVEGSIEKDGESRG